MKTLLITAAIALFSFAPQESKVWICDSQTATKYHFDKDCNGLQKCTHVIKEVTLDAAKERGLTPCKLEK